MSRGLFASALAHEIDKEQGASLLSRVLKITLLFVFILAIAGYFIMPRSAYILFGSGLLFLVFLTMFAWFLLRQQHVMPATAVFLIALWFSFSLLILFNGGVSSPAPTSFIFGVVVAGLLLGYRAAIGFAGLGVLTTAVIYFIEQTWGLPLPPLPMTATIGFAGSVMSLLATTAVYSITIRKLQKTTQALFASEAEMRAIFQAMNDAIFVVDKDGRYNRIIFTNNPTMLIAPEKILNNTFDDILPPAQARQFYDYNHQVIANQHPLQVEYSLQVGQPNWWQTTIVPLNAKQAVWIAHDMTEHKQIEEALRKSEANLREAQKIAQLGNFEFDLQTQGVQWSDETYRIFGLEIGAKVSLEQYQSLLAPEDVDRVMTAVGEAITSQQAYTIEHDILPINGPRKRLYCIGRPILDEAGQVSRIFGIVQDITKSKEVEQSLQDNIVRYRALFDNVSDAIFVYNLEGKVTTANTSACKLTGYTIEEMLGKKPDFFTVPEEYDDAYQRYEQIVVQGDHPPLYERTLNTKQGDRLICEIRARRVDDEQGNPLFFQGMVRDVTKRKQTEAQIQASLQEKEILLKEIHHRVKNNLQVISSLLDLQSAYIEDEVVLEMFQESRSRVRSMALVHEQLYRSADLARIGLADYIHDLTGYLTRSYGRMAGNVLLDVDVDKILLSVETAVPLGLIINELVSNAYKHAFADGRSGQITIRLQMLSNHQIRLIVQDNGVGLPANIDFQNSPTLGLTIIMTLVDQLQGAIHLDTQNGLRFELTFLHNEQKIGTANSHGTNQK